MAQLSKHAMQPTPVNWQSKIEDALGKCVEKQAQLIQESTSKKDVTDALKVMGELAITNEALKQ